MFTPTAGTNTLPYDVRVIEANTGIIARSANGFIGQQYLYQNENLPDGAYIIQIRSEQLVQFASGGIKWTLDVEERDDEQQTLNGSVIFSNAASFSTSAVFEFNITQQIPKIKIIDFISGMFKMFNLTAFVNDVGVIVVRTLDSYYAAGSQTPINIDQYLDTKTSKVDVALPFKEINFSYKGLGTLLAKQFEQIFNSGWGSISYKLDNRIYDAPTETYKVELPFEHMQYERLYNLNPNDNVSTTIQYGYFVDDNFESLLRRAFVILSYSKQWYINENNR